MNLILAFALAVAGALLGVKIGLPQGMLLGSLAAVAVVNVTGLLEVPKLPAPLLFAMYVLIGVELGSEVNRSTIGVLSKAWLPAVLFVAGLIAMTVAAALLISRFSDIDLTTALFGTSPGALSGITAMGGEVGANVPVVASIHALRVTVIVLVIPWIHRMLVR